MSLSTYQKISKVCSMWTPGHVDTWTSDKPLRVLFENIIPQFGDEKFLIWGAFKQFASVEVLFHGKLLIVE